MPQRCPPLPGMAGKTTPSLLDLPEVIITGILNDWLVVQDICRLDQAMTNMEERDHWLFLLQTVRSNPSMEAYEHNHCSIRWLITRGVSISHMVLKCNGLKSNTFNNFQMHSLKSVRTRAIEDFQGCSYRILDKTLVNISQGCPNLELIYLGDFITLTDNNMKQLQDFCPNLKTIGNGHVVTKRRSWHEPYNMYCRSFICALILSYLEARHLDASSIIRTRLRNIARKVERALYMVASSQEEYVDVMSLKSRLRQLVQQKLYLRSIIEQGRVIEA